MTWQLALGVKGGAFLSTICYYLESSSMPLSLMWRTQWSGIGNGLHLINSSGMTVKQKPFFYLYPDEPVVPRYLCSIEICQGHNFLLGHSAWPVDPLAMHRWFRFSQETQIFHLLNIYHIIKPSTSSTSVYHFFDFTYIMYLED